jgi:hypothetical protein
MHHKKITNFGYGGIKCPCCTPFNTVKKNQKLSNKKLRRSLRAEMEEQEEDCMQSIWEEENVKFYRDYLEGRDTVEHSSVYSKNNH